MTEMDRAINRLHGIHLAPAGDLRNSLHDVERYCGKRQARHLASKTLSLTTSPTVQFVCSKWKPMSGCFVTTGAVLTEAMHFLRPIPNGAETLVDLFRDSLLLLEDAFRPAMLDRAAHLMRRYADIPMDFADATLVVLAENFHERGFRTFRYSRNKPFRLLLQDDG